ncbi:MAG: hypothetical protein ACP5PV_13185 [Methanothrix sp.]
MAVRDVEKKLNKLERDLGAKKIRMDLKDGSTAEFRASETGEVMLDSLRIMGAIAMGDKLPSDSEESLKNIKRFSEISDEELERHPGYRWTVGLARQCLEAKPFTEEEIMELEKSCAGQYYEAMKNNGKLMLRPGKRPPP